MRVRNEKDIWRGLYDFYLIETKRNQKIESLIEKDELLSKMKITNESKLFSHLLSHQKLRVKFIEVRKTFSKKEETLAKKSRLEKFSFKKIAELPKPILIDKYLRSLNS